jgi:hypothetical protein
LRCDARRSSLTKTSFSSSRTTSSAPDIGSRCRSELSSLHFVFDIFVNKLDKIDKTFKSDKSDFCFYSYYWIAPEIIHHHE